MKKNSHAINVNSLPPNVIAMNLDALSEFGIAEMEKECPAKPDTPPKPKMTKTEELFNRVALGGKGKFEAITFRLPGGSRYTPDFITFSGGKITAYEVKGSYRLGSHGRALTAFREARAAFPFVEFRWFERDSTTSFGFVEKYPNEKGGY